MVSVPSTYAKGDLTQGYNSVVGDKYLDLGSTLGSVLGAMDPGLTLDGQSITNSLDI